jgi:vancomycin permeability regulator SanA
VRVAVRRILRPAAWCAGALAFATLLLHELVVLGAAPHLFPPDRAPAADAIVVLGASVHPNGTPSNMLLDRLACAADLFARGAAPRILVTGDGGGDGYDEVLVMRRELESRGVPANVIVADHAGFRTFDSVSRAKESFGVHRALVVTNPFHVHRATYLARAVGIDARGVAAPARIPYTATTLLRHHTREALARVLAWLDVHVLGTRPRADTD